MQRRLSQLVEELHDGFCSVRMDGELIYSNLSAREILNIEEDQSVNFLTTLLGMKSL